MEQQIRGGVGGTDTLAVGEDAEIADGRARHRGHRHPAGAHHEQRERQVGGNARERVLEEQPALPFLQARHEDDRCVQRQAETRPGGGPLYRGEKRGLDPVRDHPHRVTSEQRALARQALEPARRGHEGQRRPFVDAPLEPPVRGGRVAPHGRIRVQVRARAAAGPAQRSESSE